MQNEEHPPLPVHDPKFSKAMNVVWRIVQGLSKVVGLDAMEHNEKEMTVQFRLLSCNSLLTMIRLIMFNVPFSLVPFVLNFGGFLKYECETLNSTNSTNRTMDCETSLYLEKTRTIVRYIGYFSSYMYYVLPFLFASTMAKPLENMIKIALTENLLTKRNPSQIAKPIVAFICFIIGGFLQTISLLLNLERQYPGYTQLPLHVYSIVGVTFLSSLGLQFCLSVYEFYFYTAANNFYDLARNVFCLDFQQLTQLIVFMSSFQQCYGVFLLVDLTLMFLYWLIHLYNAYFTFQESPLAASGSVLIILAEFWRVLLLSEACHKFTMEANKVIMKLEEIRATMKDYDKRKVLTNILCSSKCFFFYSRIQDFYFF